MPRIGLTYAEVIRKAKDAVLNLEEFGIEVVGTRRTAAGGVLIEVNSKEKADLLTKKLTEKLGEDMSVRQATRTTPVLISGADESLTVEDLRTELTKLDRELDHIKPFTMRTGMNGWRTAMIESLIAAATRLDSGSKIKVGWIHCKVKILEEMKKICCLETGHLTVKCQGEDRSKCYFKCKKEGQGLRRATHGNKQWNQNMIRILQINLRRSQRAQDLVFQTTAQMVIDILVLLEYYRSGRNGRHCETNNRVAIVILTPIGITKEGVAEAGFRWIETGNIRVYTCYWSPNTTYAEYEDFISRLENSARTATGDRR